MPRVPIPLVILLSLGVIGVSWWLHTREMDFLEPPNALQIELARTYASGHLQRPAPLFAVEDEPAPIVEVEPPEPLENGTDIDPLPLPEAGRPLQLDAFADARPPDAARFIELASRLESMTRLSSALLAWERVLDTAQPDDEQRGAAVRAIKRLQASLDPRAPDESSLPVVISVFAPADRIELTRRAAREAAADLTAAAGGILAVDSSVAALDPPRSTPTLVVRLRGPQRDLPESGQREVPAPADSDEIRKAILRALHKLAAARIAAATELTPPSQADEGEEPALALANRVTRLSWRQLGESLQPPPDEADRE